MTGQDFEEDSMALRDLERRLDRLGAGRLGIGEALESVLARHRERTRAWRDAGNSGSPRRDPFRALPADATRAQRKMWRKVAEGRARLTIARGK